MDSTTITLIIHITRKYIAPVVLGGLVVWLVTNALNEWAEVVCSAAAALAIAVEASVK